METCDPEEPDEGRSDVSVRVLSPIGERGQVHHGIREAGPTHHQGVLLGRTLKRPAEMVDDHSGRTELANQGFEARRVMRFQVQLDHRVSVADASAGRLRLVRRGRRPAFQLESSVPLC